MSTITTDVDHVTGQYTLDPTHSRIGFVARHAMITKVRGSFNEFEGTAYLDAADPTNSWGKVRVTAGSIDTRNADRDAHLRGNDFLAMDEFPEITFESSAVEVLDDERFRVAGDLTIRGVTKPVAIDFEFTGAATDPFGNDRIGLEGSVVVNRKDWGVNFNAPMAAGGLLVGEKVTLEFELSAIKSAA